MARIDCSKDYFVLTSGPRLKVFPFSNPSHSEVHDLKIEIPATKSKKETSKGKDESETQKQATVEIDPHIPTGRILTTGFSKSGKLFAACTDQKQLTVWSTHPTWTKLWTRSVVKRCMSLTFDMSEAALYVADKAGDVYQYAIEGEAKEGVLLLGHVSMLLDVVVSPDDKFILTAERDEKIRVSHLPNGYNIHTFCLGHTEFVSRLAILPDENLLVSSAGDSTLRLWDYKSGKELCKTSYDWAMTTQGDSGGQKGAIVTCISCSKNNNLVAVTLLQNSSVPIYQVTNENDQWAFREITRIECAHTPWNLTFDPDGRRLFILLPDEAKPLCVYRVEKSDNSVQVIEECDGNDSATSQIIQHVCSDWEFLKCSKGIQSVFQGLHKVPVDNMPGYLERKQKRIEKTQARRGRRRKAQRKKGQKRLNDGHENEDESSAKRTLRDDDDDGEEEEEVDEEAEDNDDEENIGNGDHDKMDVEEIGS